MSLYGKPKFRPRLGSEPFRRSGFRFLSFFLAILGWCVGFKRNEKPGRNAGDVIDRGQEGAFVGL